jgi:hypothetical protein
MANWALYCRNCGKQFEHSKISDTLPNPFLAPKPDFPPAGLEFECSHCATKSIYQRQDLTLRSREE